MRYWLVATYQEIVAAGPIGDEVVSSMGPIGQHLKEILVSLEQYHRLMSVEE